MKVFIAGATGAVGRRLVARLLEAGHDVVGTTRRKDRAHEGRERARSVSSRVHLAGVLPAGRLEPWGRCLAYSTGMPLSEMPASPLTGT